MTSGEYSYLILRRLQNYASCNDGQYRAYLYNFYGSIFNDPSVVVTGESYTTFCELMDMEMDYAAKRNLRTPQDVYYDEGFQDSYALLQRSFAAINIDMELVGTSYLHFTLPSGQVKTLSNLDTLAEKLVFNCKMRVTDEYCAQTLTFWMAEQEEVKDLHVIGSNAAGFETRWAYDSYNKIMEISGEGTLTGWGLWNQLSITGIKTMIIGAGVYRFETSCFNQNLTIVDLHGEADTIIFEENFCTDSSRTYIIYSDNHSMRNAYWGSSNNIEWHSLSEWEG